RTFKSFLVGKTPPPLGLNDRAIAENFHESAVARVEKRGAIDPAGHRERKMHPEPKSLGIKPDRFVEIHRPDRDVMKSGRGAEALHGLTCPMNFSGGRVPHCERSPSSAETRLPPL